MTFPSNLYADWRARHFGPGLREGGDVPPEKLLQAVWQHQRLRRDQLNTSDGQSLRILHPGFKNREAGPDFHGAVIQFGDESPRSGDVEIDLNRSGWRAHGHDRNPNFRNVILHVVWEADRGPADRREAAALQTLGLCGVLDAPLGELDAWFGGGVPESLPEDLRGRCCPPLRELPPEKITGLLREAAHVRLQNKAAWFQARARQAGWEQSLWEGLFRALGYKQNVWPMQRLAELRTALLAGKDTSPLVLQARLLGVAGLLPAELTRTQAGTDDHLRRVWDLWWRERDRFQDVLLPRTMWKFSGLRPANHPQRRLALAAHWLAAGDLVARLERWCVEEDPDGPATPLRGRAGAPAGPARLVDSLREILQVKRDEFWSWHWTWRSARMKRPQPLLGMPRVTDLAVNAVLPWLWSRAKEGGNGRVQREIERRCLIWPSAGDNAPLKLARQRLLGGAGRRVLSGAAVQQGLLQVVRDFCGRSNAVCDACNFSDLVRVWQAKLGGGA